MVFDKTSLYLKEGKKEGSREGRKEGQGMEGRKKKNKSNLSIILYFIAVYAVVPQGWVRGRKRKLVTLGSDFTLRDVVFFLKKR